MKYQILFNHPIGGVWACHETLESAQQHITMLSKSANGFYTWNIFHDGQEIKSGKK